MSDTFFPQTIDLSASAIQLIRTALTFPKVTLDKTGLKSFDAAGNLVVAINADGTAQFSGTITASGLVLAPGTTSSPPAQNKIQWGTIADIVGTEFGTTDNLLLEAFARIAANTGRIDLEAHDTTGHTSEVGVISGSGNPSQGAQVLAVAGSDRGTNSRIVIDDLANSHFLQLVNAQQLQVTGPFDTGVLGPITQNGDVGSVAIAHGLGHNPLTVVGTLYDGNWSTLAGWRTFWNTTTVTVRIGTTAPTAQAVTAGLKFFVIG